MVERKSPSPRPSKRKEQQKEPVRSSPSVELQKDLFSDQKQTRTHMSDTSIIEYAEDLAEAEAPVPLPKGDYPAEIRSAEKKTSAKGNEYVDVVFFISPDEYPADYTEGNPDGTSLNYGRLNPAPTTQARWGMKKFCESIGATLGRTLDLNDWIGKTAIVSVVHEEWEGVQRAKIGKVLEA